MTNIKNITKELLGSTLNSFHRKTDLEQIEKNNNTQDAVLNTIFNSIDDGYASKTEQSTVMHLEGSGDGVVELVGIEGQTLVNSCENGSLELAVSDEINVEGYYPTITTGAEGGKVDVVCEGNTMVNLCTDGSKELMLNGDMDTEGAFITTTEGVDNGRVDVCCEGDTLVNLVPTPWSGQTVTGHGFFDHTNKTIRIYPDGSYGHFAIYRDGLDLLKPNTNYTLIFTTDRVGETLSKTCRLFNVNENEYYSSNRTFTIEQGIKQHKLLIDVYSNYINKKPSVQLRLTLASITEGTLTLSGFMLLEGDWTNKEIPPYFDGMKSVGQDDENGHKIEVLSQSNLADIATGGDNANFTIANVKSGKTYSIKSKRNDGSIGYNLLVVNPSNEFLTLERVVSGSYSNFNTFTVNKSGILKFNGYSNPMEVSEITLVEGAYTSGTMPTFKPYKLNKKEISLSEPLRGLPNGVKDRFVKKDGKWYVERNCGEYIIVEGNLTWEKSASQPTIGFFRGSGVVLNHKNIPIGDRNESGAISDKLRPYWFWTVNDDAETVPDNTIYYTTYNNSNVFAILRKEMTTVEEFINWLKLNPIRYVYPLATPTYELIEDPTVLTYLDATHISNNSIIPCNMKLKNTGYNTQALKANTLYTVAANLSTGSVEVDLCGVKSSMVNGVTTITTPATLNDGTLRLTGKDIRSSGVRLLEGNKTDSVPDYFEGMSSVGQDDEGGDGIKVSSNNKNLVLSKPRKYSTDIITTDVMLEPNTEYIFSTNLPHGGGKSMISINNNNISPLLTIHNWGEGDRMFTTPQAFKKGIYNLMFWKSGIHSEVTEESWLQLEKGSISTSYIEPNSNSKQIPLSEPLRGLPNGARDRFIKKDGKWYIERNCGETIFRGEDNERWWDTSSSGSTNATTMEFRGDLVSRTIYSSIGISDRFNYTDLNLWTMDEESVKSYNEFSVDIRISKLKLDSNDLDGFKSWLRSNPTKVIYPLEVTRYEPIDDPILSTYLDVTHISNDSLIPCNMKISNTKPYNCIIKPNTKYSVIFDKTKNTSNIKCNLGGADSAYTTSTTDNKIVVTTPATLVDNQLGFIGKGNTVKNIRVIEGDVDYSVPYFEGLKSSFEDKVNAEGKYGAEIEIKNKNLLDTDYILSQTNGSVGSISNGILTLGHVALNGMYCECQSDYIKVKEETEYSFLSYYLENNGANANYIMRFYNDNINMTQIGFSDGISNSVGTLSRKFKTPKGARYMKFCIGSHIYNLDGSVKSCKIDLNRTLLKIGDIDNEYMECRSNKIKFTLDEPLRGIGDVKDRLCVVNGKLMVERCFKAAVFDGSGYWVEANTDTNVNTIRYRTNPVDALINGLLVNNSLPTRTSKEPHTDTEYVGLIGSSGNIFISILKSRLGGVNFNTWLSKNPVKVVYELAEPYYEEVLNEYGEPILLKGYDNGTVYIDSLIPPTTSVRYTPKMESLKAINQIGEEVSTNTIIPNTTEALVLKMLDVEGMIYELELKHGVEVDEEQRKINNYNLIVNNLGTDMIANGLEFNPDIFDAEELGYDYSLDLVKLTKELAVKSI